MDFDSFYADLDTQPISGYLPSGRHISIPLISHIVDNLYVGGHNRVANLGDFFSHVFSFYVFENPYKTADGVVHEGFHMYDSESHVDVDTLDDAVEKIVAALNDGGNVLVHCQAGINRSNLAATRALMEWKGMTATEAIDLLSRQRDDVILSNETFRNYLLGLDDA